MSDKADKRYQDLVVACWNVFANEQAAAARIAIMLEIYPEFTAEKLRRQPEYFGPLRSDQASISHRNDCSYASTALVIRERAQQFVQALGEDVRAEQQRQQQELNQPQPQDDDHEDDNEYGR